MNTIHKYFLITAIALAFVLRPGFIRAQLVTRDQARTVAGNYIALIIGGTGSWGGSPAASVGDVEELRRDGRLLGYWCHIEPAGHVVVSLNTALEPVKAGSETWDGDPACNVDIMDVITYKIEQELDFIEARVGPIETAPPAAVERLCEISYRDAWNLLARDAADFERSPVLAGALANYQEGAVQLSTSWNQTDPYNLYMPSTTACGTEYDGRCAAGCVAIAAAQIMAYWDWPPYGLGVPYDDYYDWTLMPDKLTPQSPYQQIDETALLIVEVGQACDMEYCSDGGCASSAFHTDMISAYVGHFRFSTFAFILERTAFSSDAWFDMIRDNLNQNMPLQYGIPDHSIVCDGWRIVSDIKQYHMNYGWGNWLGEGSCWDPYIGIGSNTWFTLDALPCTALEDEEAIAYIKPVGSLGASLSGTYAAYAEFPYRYVNVDTDGESAVFQAGQMIQSLPDKIIRCTSAGSGAVKFYGAPAHHTRLFTRGDWTKGIKITNGGMALYGGGAVVLH